MKKDLLKRSLSFILAFIMVFSIVLQARNKSFAEEVDTNVITEASITDLTGNPITKPIGAWQAFRVNAKYELPNNKVKMGDTTTLTLPKGFSPASPFQFEIKAGNDVVAHGKLVDGNPTKVVITYTKYAEEHSGVKGSFYFNIQINSNTQTQTGSIPVTLTASGDGAVVPAGNVIYNPHQVAGVQLIKGGWMDSGNKTIGHYKIAINQANKEMVNAKVTDTLLNPGVQYIEDSFQILEGKWVSNEAGTDILFKEEVNVTAQYKDKLKVEGNKFTLDIGNRPAGKGMMIRYKVKISYEPVVGELFTNKVNLVDNGRNYEYKMSYKITDASGGGAGYVYKIKINKTGQNGSVLSGAEFDVIRVRNNQKVGTITTGSDGTGEIGNLVLDKYKLVETKAPSGYLPLSEPVFVEESDFAGNRVALKNVVNKPNEKISISVLKKWVGPAKDSVIVELKKAGSDTVIQEHELKANENWSYEFTGLDKYEADGTLIDYKVVEKNVPAGYEAKYEKDGTGKFIITNTNVEKTEVSVTKKWVGPAKDSVIVELKKVGSNDVIEEYELKASDNWTHKFTNLPKYENDGTEIKYEVVEKSVASGYISAIEGTMQDGFTITNTNVEKVEVSVTKKWVGPIKDSVIVELKKVGSNDVLQEYELKASDNWTHKFTNLPKYENDGTLIDYKVVEKNVPAGYEVTTEGTMQDGFTITNTNVEKVEVSVTKKWVGPAKDSVIVELKKVGSNDVIEEYELKASDNWTHKFTNLPKYENDGTEIKYEVVEKSVASGYISAIEGTMQDGFTITNTNVEKVEVSVTKKWVGPIKDSVIVELKKVGSNDVLQEYELKASDNWTHKFTNLPKYENDGTLIDYKVVEKNVPAGYEVTTEGTMQDGFTITNTNVEKVEVSVTKKWVGPAKDSVIVELKKVGSNDVLQEYELKASDNWAHKFTNLPKYENDGTEIKYEVVEKNVPAGYEAKYEKDATGKFIITNTNVEKTEASVTKKWIGPAKESVTVELKKVGSNDVLQEYELKANENWTHTFTNLPKYEADGTEIKYEVAEKSVGAGYISSIEGTMENGFTITNTNVEKTEVSVTKKWIGPTKDSVIVELRKVGSNNVIQEYELKASDNWAHTFTNLPKYENDGTEIKYEVVEKNVPAGYEVKYEKDATGKFIITNTNVEKTEASVTKKWIGPAKESVTVELKKVGSNDVLQEYELKASENWTHTFTNLPKYEADGTEIKYEVVEKNVPAGYEAKYEKDATGKFIITNTNVEKTEVSVTKKWIGPAKNSVIVELKKVGSNDVLQEYELKASENWTHTFTNLPKYEADGTEIKYEVAEKSVGAGYISSIEGTMENGFTITNTNVEKTEVSVEKKWIGPAKDSVIVELRKVGSNNVIQEYELKASDNWAHTFTNLPKYEADGTEIKYEVVEKNVPAGYEVKYEKDATGKFIITNTNVEKTEASVTKKWIGPAKESVTVELKKVGSNDVLQEYELKANENWTHTFTNLPKYEADGTEIKYEVVEKNVPAGYEAKYEKDATGKFIITNTNVEKTEVSVEKKWVGPVGNSVIVELKKVGSDDIIEEYELKANENWKHIFTNLPKYEDDGTKIEYKVVEKNVPAGYEVSYEKDATGNVVIKNTKIKTEVKVTKEWSENEEHPTIKLQLLKNGQIEGDVVELSNGNTTYTWTNLDKADAQGNDYVYTVKEVGEVGNHIKLGDSWYKVIYGGNQQTGLTVTNKKLTPWTPIVPPTRNLKVTKEWLGTNGNQITAPVDKIEVELYRDGKATGQKLELNRENNWTGEFKNLKVYESIENSKTYEYTVNEVGEKNNSVKFDDKIFKVSYLGNMKDGIKVVNTESPALPPSTPSEKPKKPKLAKTGIATSTSIYSGILAISGGIMLFLKKRNQNKDTNF